MLETMDNEAWEFFHALCKCRLLNVLSLSNNKLRGVIPNSVANLSTHLTYLYMGGNNLSGIVPQSIGNVVGLISLALDFNSLTGTIEEWIGKLTSLQHLNLQSNNFIGTIPPSISNLKLLIFLNLANNKFTGATPCSLGNIKKLLTLNLSYNDFQGGIPIEFGNIRQLTTLDLSSNKFSGEVPDSFGQFEQITTIRMDNNILTGTIPITFKNLYMLSILNLSHNDLTGPMPACVNNLKALTKLDLSFNNFQGEVLTNGLFDNATVVSLDGNPGLCGGATDMHLPSCRAVRKRKTSRRTYPHQSFGEHFEGVTYNDLAQATRDFSESNLIGRGSYGSVYSGKLKGSKMEVAVKVFNLEMRGAERSFLSECEALRSIQHRNLLRIITACSSSVFKALVYELMPNGNLDTWLHHIGDNEASKRLGLTQRISIAVNVADALDYLHHDCGRTTVHYDLKPSNILLDDDMNALLGDFGIARFYADPQSTHAGSDSSVGVKGTIGYIPPEYGGGGHASTSGDVYSFGIVLLEMLTSKRPTDVMFMDGLDIISFVENSFLNLIFHVIDAHLVEECKKLSQENNVPENEIYQCLVDLLQVELSCTRSLPSQRSNMKHVASKVHAIKTSHFGWKYNKKE